MAIFEDSGFEAIKGVQPEIEERRKCLRWSLALGDVQIMFKTNDH